MVETSLGEEGGVPPQSVPRRHFAFGQYQWLIVQTRWNPTRR